MGIKSRHFLLVNKPHRFHFPLFFVKVFKRYSEANKGMTSKVKSLRMFWHSNFYRKYYQISSMFGTVEINFYKVTWAEGWIKLFWSKSVRCMSSLTLSSKTFHIFIFSKTISLRPISIKFGTMHNWMKGTHNLFK